MPRSVIKRSDWVVILFLENAHCDLAAWVSYRASLNFSNRHEIDSKLGESDEKIWLLGTGNAQQVHGEQLAARFAQKQLLTS
jgi:hypothetical protein